MNYLQLPTQVLPHLRRLSAVQLAIFADAWTWQQNGKESRRSNKQFAEMMNVSPKSASDAIAGLVKAGLMTWSMDGGGRVLTATLPSNFQPPVELLPSGSTSIPSNFYPPSGLTSTPPPDELPSPLPFNFHQIEKGIKKGREKEIENGAPKLKKNGNTVQLDTKARPFDVDEVIDYFLELEDTPEEAANFYDYWTSAGWRRKAGPIKDWKATARTWMRSPYRKQKPKTVIDTARAVMEDFINNPR